MPPEASGRARPSLIWALVAAAILLPLVFAAASPLLQWRQPVYIAAGFAGILALGLMLLQPLLAAGLLPGLGGPRGRRLHRWTGALLVTFVLLHIAGLYLTSPPDVIDVLLLRSPTPFSLWAMIALIPLLAAALLAAFRRRLRLAPRTWRRMHLALVSIAILGTAGHALLIEGTMEWWTKLGLCGVVAGATGWVAVRAWRASRRRDAGP
ncbi:ferric reductase-like transmembrane domain-containing protein [Roseibium sp. M-1]